MTVLGYEMCTASGWKLSQNLGDNAVREMENKDKGELVLDMNIKLVKWGILMEFDEWPWKVSVAKVGQQVFLELSWELSPETLDESWKDQFFYRNFEQIINILRNS